MWLAMVSYNGRVSIVELKSNLNSSLILIKMNSLQYFKLTSFPFIFRFSPSTIFKLLHFYFFTMIFNSYMIDKNFWTSRQVSGRAKFYIIQHGRLLLKNISVNIFSSGVNFVLLSTYMLSTYWLLCCQRIVHVVNVLIFRRVSNVAFPMCRTHSKQ